jgi:hypothetical protein
VVVAVASAMTSIAFAKARAAGINCEFEQHVVSRQRQRNDIRVNGFRKAFNITVV